MASPALAIDAELDNTFDDDGHFQVNLSNAATDDFGVETIMRPQGGYYLLGSAPLDGDFGLVATITAITVAGDLNTGFGTGGVVQVTGAQAPDNAVPTTIGVDGSGRLLLASGVAGEPDKIRIWRISSSGAPDVAFGAGGVRTYSLPAMAGAWDSQAVSLDDLAFDGSGRLVASGSATGTPQGGGPLVERGLLVRIVPGDPGLDAGFGAAGRVYVDSATPELEKFDGIHADASGRIFGRTSVMVAASTNYGLQARSATGAPLPGFAGGSGEMVVPMPGAFTWWTPTALARDPSGRFLVAGTYFDGMGPTIRTGVARLTVTGALDPSFGVGGYALLDGPPGSVGVEFHDITVDDDGNIQLVGAAYMGFANRDTVVAQLTSGGALDANFDGDGYYHFDLSGAGIDDYAVHGVLELAGALMVTPWISTDSTALDTALLRVGDGDRVAPVPPTLSSPSHPVGTSGNWKLHGSGWRRNDRVTVKLSGGSDNLSGVQGYSVAWSQSPFTVPSPTVNSAAGTTAIKSAKLKSGMWWFHLRSVDAVGNWSDTVHLGPVGVDAVKPRPPAVRGFSLSRKTRYWTISRHKVGWVRATDTLSGIRSYEVQRREARGHLGKMKGWKPWRRSTRQESAIRRMPPGSSLCVRARSYDRAGNVSRWAKPKCFHRAYPIFKSKAIHWKLRKSKRSISGHVRVSRDRAARIYQRYQGKRLGSVVVSMCGRCGKVDIIHQGKKVRRFNTRSKWRFFKRRVRVFASNKARSGKIVLRPVPNSGPVYIEGFYFRG